MLRYLALGDSYTIGEAVAAEGRWPQQLVDRLNAEGIAIADPQIIATTGWTTDELSAAMDAAEPIAPADFVTLGIGVNNQYRGRSVDDYMRELTRLVKRALLLAQSRRQHVMMASIPDWGVTPYAQASGRDLTQIAEEIDAYNQAAHAVCDAFGIAFVDITAVSREKGARSEMLAEDGLHPSAIMYAEWVQRLYPVARRLLGLNA